MKPSPQRVTRQSDVTDHTKYKVVTALKPLSLAPDPAGAPIAAERALRHALVQASPSTALPLLHSCSGFQHRANHHHSGPRWRCGRCCHRLGHSRPSRSLRRDRYQPGGLAGLFHHRSADCDSLEKLDTLPGADRTRQRRMVIVHGPRSQPMVAATAPTLTITREDTFAALSRS